MANPIMQMLNRAPQASANPANMFSQIKQFMGCMQGRNPEQLLQNFIKQNNVSSQQVNEVRARAEEICRMFNLK